MKQRALIDINMLLDTRYGVLARLNKTAARLIVQSDWYSIRDTDDFEKASDGVIKNEEYRELYLKYEVETLANAFLTNFVYELRMDVKQGMGEFDRIQPDTEFTFYVNTYPYQLLENEIEIIKRSFERLMPLRANVEMVYIDYAELTPKVLDGRYEMMALYNYEDWLRHHHVELRSNPITTFCLFGARIAPSGVSMGPIQDIHDPFSIPSMALSHHIQLTLVPSAWSCCNYTVLKEMGVDLNQL